MEQKTYLAVTRPQIAAAIGVGMAAFNAFMVVARDDTARGRQHQRTKGGALKTCYNLSQIVDFLTRTCPMRFDVAARARLEAVAFEAEMTVH